MPYLGFEPTASDTITVYRYVAIGGQTDFTGTDANGLTLSYDTGDGSCQVWLNGIKLDSSDITATNGTTVVLAACTVGDIVHIQATKAFIPADVVPKAAGGTFDGAITAPSLTLSSTPLPVASGGTGAATHAANGVLLGAGTGAVTTAAPGSSGNVLTSNGTVWASAAAPSTDLTAIADGTVSAPSLANSGDNNTGVYFPAADTVGITTGGKEQFRFGSNRIQGGFKNLLINGGWAIWQRGTSLGGTDDAGNAYGSANYQYFADGWCTYYGYGSSARYSMARSTTADGTTGTYSLQLHIDTADTDNSTANRFTGIIQKIEGQNIRRLLNYGTSNAKACTLSFWMRSYVAGTHCVALYSEDTNRACPLEFTVAASNVWEKHSVTFPGDDNTGFSEFGADENASLWVVFPFHTGSTYHGTEAQWQANEKYATSNMVNMVGTANVYILLADVQLEVGSVATDFEMVDYGTDLARCQRYYYQFDITGGNRFIGGGYDPTNILCSKVEFPVTMRTSPTVRVQNDKYRVAHDGSIHDSSVGLSFNIDKWGYMVQVGSDLSTITQGETYWILNNGGTAANARVQFTAEL